MESEKALVVFQGKDIRRIWFNDEWWFSVIDIIAALTESGRARKYWTDLKNKLRDEGFEVSEKIGQFKLPAEDGKLRLTDCISTKNMFRLIQSIPSPKAEPFKRWLASVGYERIKEIENPELAQERVKKYYELKGYPKDWIEKRMRGIAIRQELTDEWRGGGFRDTDKRDLKSDLQQNSFRIQGIQGASPQKPEPARPHERLGTDLNDDRREGYDRHNRRKGFARL